MDGGGGVSQGLDSEGATAPAASWIFFFMFRNSNLIQSTGVLLLEET